MILELNNGGEHIFHVAEVQEDLWKGGRSWDTAVELERKGKALVQSSSKSVAT